MFITKQDECGAYIELPDDDNDFVTLMKDVDGYKYRIRGDAIERLRQLEIMTGCIGMNVGKQIKGYAYGEAEAIHC